MVMSGIRRHRMAAIASVLFVVFTVIAGLLFTVSVTSLQYSTTGIAIGSERTFQTTVITTLEHAEIQVSTSGNSTYTTTISTGYGYVTGVFNTSTPTLATYALTTTETNTCVVPFWYWLFGRPANCP